MLAAACGLALAFAGAQAADARPGDPDPSFDGDGIATPGVGAVGTGSVLEAVTARPDGRVVAAGWADNANGIDEPVVVQLTVAGAPDAAFGATAPGVTRTASGGPDTRLHDVGVDDAGRVLAAAGREAAGAPVLLPAVLRFSATGIPDTAFAGGIGSTTGEARAIVPLAGGGSIVAGWRGGTTQEAFFVAKLTASGALDGSFSGDGIVDVLGAGARAEAVALDAQGRIVVAGWIPFNTGSETILQAVLVRLTAAGVPDPSFGDQGIVNASASNPDGDAVGQLHAVGVDSAGRIVAAGASGPHAFVTRRLDNGAPDPTFGAGGAVFGTPAAFSTLSGLALDDTRSVVAGGASGDLPGQILLGGLDPAGSPDPVFGGSPAGWRTFASPMAGSAEALDAAPSGNGGVYTAGSLVAPNEQSTAFVGRHQGNGPPSATLAAAASVVAGAPVTFDAGGSSDPEGEALRFAFDLDGDGSYEFDGGGNPLALRSFPAAGSYTVGVRVTDPRGASATAAHSIAVSAAQQPVPQPVLSQQGVARPVRGIIRIRLPGTKKFVRITELTAIPNGTEIDARRGRVLLTVLHDASGRLDGAEFYAGRFIFRQGRGAVPITTLKLSGGSFAGCARKSKARRSLLAATASAQGGRKGKKPVRKLWGDGRGRFRTRGKWGAATVRGTKWLTQDRCDGTRIKVVRGKVDADDLVRPRRKTKRLKAGDSILIRKRG